VLPAGQENTLGSMRVIAGEFKGRRLKTPTWDGLRPTSDKLRETLFNILAPRITGARVVDGFAGTGAIGIEALSRGAAHVTFIEKDRRAALLIEQNVSSCDIEAAGFAIERGDVGDVLRRLPGETAFDVIVLDPPYDAAALEQTLDAAAARLPPHGVLVLERATRREPDIPSSLMLIRNVKSGDSTLTFLQRRI
jgi:16S rRNA (guanine966-N2)-methyltransferase